MAGEAGDVLHAGHQVVRHLGRHLLRQRRLLLTSFLHLQQLDERFDGDALGVREVRGNGVREERKGGKEGILRRMERRGKQNNIKEHEEEGEKRGS